MSITWTIKSQRWYRPEVDTLRAVREWPVPTIISVRSFLGLCSYYRRYVKGFAQIFKPLHDVVPLCKSGGNTRRRHNQSQQNGREATPTLPCNFHHAERCTHFCSCTWVCWPGLQASVQDLKSRCKICTLAKMPYRPLRNKMMEIGLVNRPLEVLCPDFDKLGQTCDKEDMLVITDIYSKFSVAMAPNTRAPSQYKDRLIYVWRFPC